VLDAVVCSDEFDNGFKEVLIVRWLISAYAAAVRKEFDNFRNRGVLVFQGKQGVGKTTFLRKLIGADWGGNKLWFGEGRTLDVEVKDSLIRAIGFWITELAELENTTKKGMSGLKAFLTSSEDTLRKPYAAEETNFTRRTVFAGTVNEKGFLTDSTGNTRFWVIPVVKFEDISHIDMQQVWAKVRMLYEAGEQWHLKQNEEIKLEECNAEYIQEEAIDSYLGKGLDWDAVSENWEYKSTTEALIECGLREPKKADCRAATKYLEKQLGKNFKRRIQRGLWQILLPPQKKEVKSWDKGFIPTSSSVNAEESWHNK